VSRAERPERDEGDTDAREREVRDEASPRPVNSTRTSSANEPKAAKSEVCGCPITLSAKANTAGMTIAARAALLTATLCPTALDCRRRNLMRSAGNAPRR
jgi:hypothetical protein